MSEPGFITNFMNGATVEGVIIGALLMMIAMFAAAMIEILKYRYLVEEKEEGDKHQVEKPYT